MLSQGKAAAMETWVRAANGWSESAQTLVGAAAELALASRSLANVGGRLGVGDQP